MGKVIENIGIRKVLEEIRKLNNVSKEEIHIDSNVSGSNVIVTTLNMKILKYPEGYYYSSKNCVTNKHNTTSGIYESFFVIYKN